ncbi:MAG: energy transducer TonB [Hymenobacteraceae bacterium]|nr:energy transducer TonB [Hymenobacteraceae bacterium]
MTSTLPDLSRASLNDIIFEGRNKAYGAYELRRIYPRHLKRAVAAMLVVCAAILAGPRVLEYWSPAEVAVPKPRLIEDDLRVITEVPKFEDPAPPVQPVAATPPPPVATTQFVRPVIVTNQPAVIDPVLTTMAQANNAENLGAQTLEGIDAPAALLAEAVAVPTADNPAAIFTNVQTMPEYPGGIAALLRFVAHHTKYPPLALRNSIEGRVYLRFVVDETGQVMNPVVVKGIGGGCDEEAVRVLRTLPRFTPGQQNGRPVKVYFSLPISFTMVK